MITINLPLEYYFSDIINLAVRNRINPDCIAILKAVRDTERIKSFEQIIRDPSLKYSPNMGYDEVIDIDDFLDFIFLNADTIREKLGLGKAQKKEPVEYRVIQSMLKNREELLDILNYANHRQHPAEKILEDAYNRNTDGLILFFWDVYDNPRRKKFYEGTAPGLDEEYNFDAEDLLDFLADNADIIENHYKSIFATWSDEVGGEDNNEP